MQTLMLNVQQTILSRLEQLQPSVAKHVYQKLNKHLKYCEGLLEIKKLKAASLDPVLTKWEALSPLKWKRPTSSVGRNFFGTVYIHTRRRVALTKISCETACQSYEKGQAWWSLERSRIQYPKDHVCLGTWFPRVLVQNSNQHVIQWLWMEAFFLPHLNDATAFFVPVTCENKSSVK